MGNMFSDLITSKSRVKLLQVFLSNPADMFHVRELVRKTEDEINAVRRELAFLEEKGILVREPRANRVYYSLDKNYPFYFDMLHIGAKTIGLGLEILKNRARLGKIKYAMFSGRFVRRQKKEPDDVDLLLVGTVVLPELALLVKNEERRLTTEINYTVMTEDEFAFRKKKSDPFVSSVLSGSRLMLIGDEESMLS
jgi:DNA-binding transcriptional ArsR family regulator